MSFVTFNHSDQGIFGFVNQYYFLSNFYTEGDQKIDFYWVNKGKLKYLLCNNVEVPFQASKTFVPKDIEYILDSDGPGEAKKRGNEIHTLRKDWDQVKLGIMKDFIYQKYLNSPELWLALWMTENKPLSEWNSWGDSYWGMVQNKEGRWVGANWLGRLTMIVRGQLNNLCDCCKRLPSIYLVETTKLCIACLDHDPVFAPCSGIEKPKSHSLEEYQ